MKEKVSKKVSVIVPVYNSPAVIKTCLNSLLNQTYPKDLYEIICVDNSSTDETPNIIKTFSEVKYLKETKRSSYAARNLGLSKSNGEILAFTDADCIIDDNWIQNAITRFNNDDVDLIGGRIQFMFKNYNNIFEVYDSLYKMNQKETVKRKMSATANLFIRREVFDKIGFFKEDLISGGDSEFCTRAIQNGFNL